jgi:hypothetical protein
MAKPSPNTGRKVEKTRQDARCAIVQRHIRLIPADRLRGPTKANNAILAESSCGAGSSRLPS